MKYLTILFVFFIGGAYLMWPSKVTAKSYIEYFEKNSHYFSKNIVIKEQKISYHLIPASIRNARALLRGAEFDSALDSFYYLTFSIKKNNETDSLAGILYSNIENTLSVNIDNKPANLIAMYNENLGNPLEIRMTAVVEHCGSLDVADIEFKVGDDPHKLTFDYSSLDIPLLKK